MAGNVAIFRIAFFVRIESSGFTGVMVCCLADEVALVSSLFSTSCLRSGVACTLVGTAGTAIGSFAADEAAVLSNLLPHSEQNLPLGPIHVLTVHEGH